MESKEDLAIGRISECGQLADHFFEIYDKLIQRGFKKKDALTTAKELINAFICYKAGLVIDEQEQEPIVILEAE